MTDYLGDEYTFTLSKEIRYLRQILNSLKPVTRQPGSDWSKIVEEQDKILNTLREDFAVSMTNLEQRLKQNTIRIFGIHEDPGEETKLVVLDFFQKKLNVELNVLDIDSCYRSGAHKSWQPRAVVVKFVSNDVRKRIWRRRHVVESAGSGMSEELCSERSKIWKEAVNKFGRSCVAVVEGSVEIKMADGRFERFLTFAQFWDFLKKYEYNFKNGYN